jgi:hypothetical protein
MISFNLLLVCRQIDTSIYIFIHFTNCGIFFILLSYSSRHSNVKVNVTKKLKHLRKLTSLRRECKRHPLEKFDNFDFHIFIRILCGFEEKIGKG